MNFIQIGLDIAGSKRGLLAADDYLEEDPVLINLSQICGWLSIKLNTNFFEMQAE